MRNIFKLRKEDLIWHLTPSKMKQVVNQALQCINDPTASYRDKNIACKNLLMCNAQNQTLCDEVESNQKVEITINEVGINECKKD